MVKDRELASVGHLCLHTSNRMSMGYIYIYDAYCIPHMYIHVIFDLGWSESGGYLEMQL